MSVMNVYVQQRLILCAKPVEDWRQPPVSFVAFESTVGDGDEPTPSFQNSTDLVAKKPNLVWTAATERVDRALVQDDVERRVREVAL